MNDEDAWKRRFLIFTFARLGGLLIVVLGLVVAFTDLVRPDGWRGLGAALIALGTIEGALLPTFLKARWNR